MHWRHSWFGGVLRKKIRRERAVAWSVAWLGCLGLCPAGKVPRLTLLQDKFPQNGCKNETARGAICLFSGVQGGGRAANHPYNKFTVWGLLRAMLLSDFRQAGVYSGEDPKAELVLTF